MLNWLQLRHLILLIALAPLAYYLLASIAALRFFTKRREETEGFAPPISILKPVRGLDPGAYENFSSFCTLNYPEYEIIFNVADEHDAAIPVIEKIMRDFPEREIRMLVGAERLGVSNKVNKLSRMVDEAQYEHVVISDSDIRVSDGYLKSVIAPFSNPKIGAVTCLYRGIPNSSIGSEFEDAVAKRSDFVFRGKVQAFAFNLEAGFREISGETAAMPFIARRDDDFCASFGQGSRDRSA